MYDLLSILFAQKEGLYKFQFKRFELLQGKALHNYLLLLLLQWNAMTIKGSLNIYMFSDSLNTTDEFHW